MNNRQILNYMGWELITGTLSQKKDFLTKARKRCKNKLGYYILSNLERNKMERVEELTTLLNTL